MILTRELPGAAKYVNRRGVSSNNCCVVSCSHPAHTGYSTNFNVHFCVTHWKRYLLLKLAEQFFPECLMSASKSLKYSRLQAWIDLATRGNRETINQTIRAFETEMQAFGVDQRTML